MDAGPLSIELFAVVEKICAGLRQALAEDLGRRGYVVAMSGGVDSSVCAALAVRALGRERVFGLLLPERDSDPLSHVLASRLAGQLGIAHETEDITPVLEAAGCYARRDEAIRRVAPGYGVGWKCKLVRSGAGPGKDRLNITSLLVEDPGGRESRVRLGAREYRQIVAATNFKQRVRKMMEYYHADRLHYAVIGTPNRLEYDQGFFVKGGDGLADIKPIAHLYKTQVCALAAFLGIPEGIISRPPTTDTFPLAQTQEEFFFGFPTPVLDQLLFAYNEQRPAAEVAQELGLSHEDVLRAWTDIARKRVATRYLHRAAVLVEPVALPLRPAGVPV